MKTNMKLYLWTDVYCDYTCGCAFAIAKTEEEAKILITKNIMEGTNSKPENWDHVHAITLRDLAEGTLEVHDLKKPFAFKIYGGA